MRYIALVLLTAAACHQDDGFRARMADGCHTADDCRALADEANRRYLACRADCAGHDADRQQAAAWLHAARNPPAPAPAPAPTPPVPKNPFAPRRVVTDPCGDQVTMPLFYAAPRVPAKDIEDLDEAEAKVEAARKRLGELQCGERTDRTQKHLDNALARIQTERACRASEECMAKRYAAPICDAIDAKRWAAKEMARERANPSGTVNLRALNDLGRQMQDADDIIADAKAEYARKTKTPFSERLCK